MRRIAVAVSFLALLPASASAKGGGSLLSGYGGPGDGEQALLGSHFVAPRAGGAVPGPRAIYAAGAVASGGANSGSASSGSANGGSEGGGAAGAGSSSGGAGSSPRPAHTRPTHTRPHKPPVDSTTPAVTRPQARAPSAGATASPVSAPAPLSGRDLGLLAALLAGVLILAGSARRLAVRAAAARRPTAQ